MSQVLTFNKYGELDSWSHRYIPVDVFRKGLVTSIGKSNLRGEYSTSNLSAYRFEFVYGGPDGIIRCELNVNCMRKLNGKWYFTRPEDATHFRVNIGGHHSRGTGSRKVDWYGWYERLMKLWDHYSNPPAPKWSDVVSQDDVDKIVNLMWVACGGLNGDWIERYDAIVAIKGRIRRLGLS